MKANQILKELNDFTTNLYRSYPRAYLGYSQIGRPCLREIFFSWRFASIEVFSPRILNLFNRGNREEDEIIDQLRGAGFETKTIDATTGRQFEICPDKYNGFVKGHCDGFSKIDGYWHLDEFKTAAGKKWVALNRSKSVEITFPHYYVQCQMYMEEFNVDRTLFICVNKDTDHKYIEILKPNRSVVDSMNERIVELLTTTSVPKRCSEQPNYWHCNYCWFKSICFFGQPVRKSCRLCKEVKMAQDGKWMCGGTSLSLNKQLKGCKAFNQIEGV